MSCESHVSKVNEWPEVRLGDLISLRGGLSYKGDEISDEGNSMVTMGCITPTEPFKLSGLKRYKGTFGQQHLLQPGDIVIATRDVTQNRELIGCPAIVPDNLPGESIIAATNLYKVTNHSDVENQFLYWAIKSPQYREQIIASAKGTTVVMLTKDAVENYVFKLPPQNERRAISDFLSGIDARIALLRETNATLEAIAQALFKSWFVDFDPVRARMAGRAPEGMDEATAALFPDALEETELGLVPKGWRVGKVSDLGDVVCGKTPPTSCVENYGDDVPFITIPDMHGLLAVTETARSLSRQGADSQPKKYLPAGAVCVSCIATPGLVVQVTTPSQTNQQINSVIPFDLWGEAFPLFLLRRVGGAVRMGGSGGSVFHNLSKSGFEAISVLLPSHALAQAFNNYAEPLIKRIVENQRQVKVLSDLRDTLLPRLISGQLRLSDNECESATN